MLYFMLRLIVLLTLIFASLVAFLKPIGMLRAYEPFVYTALDDDSAHSIRLHNLVTGHDVLLFNGDNLRISDVSPDGNLIYTETIDDVPHMIVRNAHTLRVHSILTDFDRPAVWSFDGTRFAYVDQNDEVFILRIVYLHEPTETAQFLPVLTRPFNLAWMADDERLSYWEATTAINYQLVAIHSQTGEHEELFNWIARTQNTAWFPDGRSGLFGTVHNTYQFDLATGEATKLNNRQYDRNSLHIAQDGQRILYTLLTFGGRVIFLADRTGELPQPIQLNDTGLTLSVGWWQTD